MKVNTLNSVTDWEKYISGFKTIPNEIVSSAKKVSRKLYVADSTGMELSGNKFIMLSIVFKNLLSPMLKKQNTGLLLPSSSMGAVTNTSIFMLGKTAVNINYTADLIGVSQGLENAGVEEIVASKAFVDKLKEKGFDIDFLFEGKKIIYLEELKLQISKVKAIFLLLLVSIFPAWLIQMIWVKSVCMEDTLLILFSSGSEGVPKGIRLSHKNILGNIKQASLVMDFDVNKDVMMGTLPLFHAFGIMATTLLPMIEGIPMVAHPDPTDAYGLGKVVFKYKGTILCGTSTFLNIYVRNNKLEPIMFSSLRLVVAGAEKLNNKVRRTFRDKFLIDICEGYGVTETSPGISLSSPDTMSDDFKTIKNNIIGKVGVAFPGTKIKIVDPDTHADLGVNEAGMIIANGIQIMQGYLNNEEKTKEVLIKLDGVTWYVTGDKGSLDENGFLTIIDRYSRFAKIGGEMVPLSLVENKVSDILENMQPDNSMDVFAVNIPDEKKGEMIVLLITSDEPIVIDMIQKEIRVKMVNKLYIPGHYLQLDELPKLGSGKKDFTGAKKLVLELLKI